jgi:putative transposase
VDEYTRECLAIDVAGSIRSARVIEVLARLTSERGNPVHLRSDNGPEFVSKALLRWATKESLGIALIDPGKPWQNGMVESFGRGRNHPFGWPPAQIPASGTTALGSYLGCLA